MTLKVILNWGSMFMPLPSSANIKVCGIYPTIDPAKKAIARALETPAKRFVIKLLPSGKRRMRSVVEKVLFSTNESAFLIRLEKRFDTMSRPINRAKKNDTTQPIAVAVRAKQTPRTSPKAYPPRKETIWRGKHTATNITAPVKNKTSLSGREQPKAPQYRPILYGAPFAICRMRQARPKPFVLK